MEKFVFSRKMCVAPRFQVLNRAEFVTHDFTGEHTANKTMTFVSEPIATGRSTFDTQHHSRTKQTMSNEMKQKTVMIEDPADATAGRRR